MWNLRHGGREGWRKPKAARVGVRYRELRGRDRFRGKDGKWESEVCKEYAVGCVSDPGTWTGSEFNPGSFEICGREGDWSEDTKGCEG